MTDHELLSATSAMAIEINRKVVEMLTEIKQLRSERDTAELMSLALKAELDALREQEPAILPDEAYELGLDAIPYYAAPTPPSVPEGWQLVPKEPTEEMLNSVRREMEWCNPVGIFSKMLKAAPKPGEME